MKFVERDSVWLLIDEAAPQDACVIATLRSLVEVVAVKTFCERTLAHQSAEPYSFRHDHRAYTVVPFQDRGGKLSLRITGEDGWLGRVETEFVVDGLAPGGGAVV